MSKIQKWWDKKFGKRYYIPGVDEIHQYEETPASKAKTEYHRYITSLVISIIAAVAAIVAATISIMTYLAG